MSEVAKKHGVSDVTIYAWRADIFYMNWKDIQADYSIGQQLPNDGGVYFLTGIANATGARSYGMETEVTALVARGLTVDAGAGYNRAYYLTYTDAQTAPGSRGI